MTAPLRIALLTHSTLPRGGVVHTLELGDALASLGHRVWVYAPDAGGGFFRTTRCTSVPIPVRAMAGDLEGRVAACMEDYLNYFSRPGSLDFDVIHAQDSISGNVLASLVEQGRLNGFLRTVHHLDDFERPRLAAWQQRALSSATQVLCVSRHWRDILCREHDIEATIVGNGVDTHRFSPLAASRDPFVGRHLGLRGGPLFLSVGGIEERKNSLRILQAFIHLLPQLPAAGLIFAGGASLLDHSAYRQRFDRALAASGAAASVIQTGALAEEDMPSLYRLADALVFPSLKEGFGLAALEAIASGTPAVVPDQAPFNEYLNDRAAIKVNPLDSAAIAAGMRQALLPRTLANLRQAAPALLSRHSWIASAQSHLSVYRSYIEEHAHARNAFSHPLARRQ